MSLVNYQDKKQKHVEFVSYTGKYPNLCSGTLTLKIDGAEWRFGYKEKNLPFWRSGGSCGFNDNWEECVTVGEWVIDVLGLPEEIKKYATEIDEVFNENVEFGCCGGCI